MKIKDKPQQILLDRYNPNKKAYNRRYNLFRSLGYVQTKVNGRVVTLTLKK